MTKESNARSNSVRYFVFSHSIYPKFSMNDTTTVTKQSIGKSITTSLLVLSILFVLIIVGLIYTLQSRYFNRENDNRLNNEYIYSELLIKN